VSETTQTDLKAVLARIDRDMAETRKFVAEQGKFVAEQGKFVAEQGKLQAELGKLQAEQVKFYAEQAKLPRDRYLAPWLAIAGLVGGVVTVITLLARLFGRG
jgi:hypothetical protein